MEAINILSFAIIALFSAAAVAYATIAEPRQTVPLKCTGCVATITSTTYGATRPAGQQCISDLAEDITLDGRWDWTPNNALTNFGDHFRLDGHGTTGPVGFPCLKVDSFPIKFFHKTCDLDEGNWHATFDCAAIDCVPAPECE